MGGCVFLLRGTRWGEQGGSVSHSTDILSYFMTTYALCARRHLLPLRPRRRRSSVREPRHMVNAIIPPSSPPELRQVLKIYVDLPPGGQAAVAFMESTPEIPKFPVSCSLFAVFPLLRRLLCSATFLFPNEKMTDFGRKQRHQMVTFEIAAVFRSPALSQICQ